MQPQVGFGAGAAAAVPPPPPASFGGIGGAAAPSVVVSNPQTAVDETCSKISIALDQLRSAIQSQSPLPDSLCKLLTGLFASPYAKFVSSSSTTAGASSLALMDGTSPEEQAKFIESLTIGQGLLEVLLQVGGGDMTTPPSPTRSIDALVGPISGTCIASIIAFLGKGEAACGYAPPSSSSSSPSATGVKLGLGTADGCYAQGGGRHHPLLLAAQALFVLTQCFQATEQHIVQLTATVDILLDEATRVATAWNGSPGGAGGARSSVLLQFRNQELSRHLCTVTYLSVLSLCNMLSVWHPLRPVSGGEPISNQLLTSATVPVFVESWLQKTSERLAAAAAALNRGGLDVGTFSLGGGGGLSASNSPSLLLNRRSTIPLTPALGPLAGGASSTAGSSQTGQSATPGGGVYSMYAATAMQQCSVPLSFLTFVQLALGAFYVQRRDVDKASDWIITACVGDRSDPRWLRSSQQQQQQQQVHAGGKVWKRLLQLAPRQASLAVPLTRITTSLVQWISFLVDDALPPIHHVADLDVKSYYHFQDQQREEELAALQAPASAQLFRSVGMLSALPGGGINGGGNTQQLPRGSTAPNSSGANHSSSFSSEFAHLLDLIRWCLSTLPTSTLDPVSDGNNNNNNNGDGSDETALTFFVFRNCIAHLRATLEAQRQDAVWEPFAHKVVASFISVITVMCKHSPSRARVVKMLSESQIECIELQWSALSNQAREAAGINQQQQQLQHSVMLIASGSGDGDAASRGIMSRINGGGSGKNTRAYAQKQTDRFLVAVLSLFRTLVEEDSTHRTLNAPTSPAGSLVSTQLPTGLSYAVAFDFLRAPSLTSKSLGEVLSLTASLVLHTGDADRAWQTLSEAGLLQVPPGANSALNSGGEAGGGAVRRGFSSSNSATTSSSSSGAAGSATTATRSLLGHVLHETVVGEYPITVGFLKLLFACFHVWSSSAAPQKNNSGVSSSSYSVTQARSNVAGEATAVVKFVADEIASHSRKRYLQLSSSTTQTLSDDSSSPSLDGEVGGRVVVSLASAVLSAAAELRFFTAQQQQQQQPSSSLSDSSATTASSSSASTTSISMSLIMATFKAPADVLGDLLDTLYALASQSFSEVLQSAEICLLRHHLQLLEKKLKSQPQDDSFRLHGNVDLVVALLKLIVSCPDPIVSHVAIAVLSLLPSSTMSASSRFLMMRPELSHRLRTLFAQLLDPRTENYTSLEHDTATQLVDRLLFEPRTTAADFGVSTKALFMDLLVKSAAAPHPSLLSWLSGCQVHRFPTGGGSGIPSSSSTATTTNAAETSSFPSLENSSLVCLEAILRSANDKAFAVAYPSLATKYVRLLYLLKANVSISHHEVVEQGLHARGAENYLSWVLRCGSVFETHDSIARHGLALKTIALDAYHAIARPAATTTAGSSSSSMRRSLSSGCSNYAVRVMERLLCDTRGTNAVSGNAAVAGWGGGVGGGYQTQTHSSSLYPVARSAFSAYLGSDANEEENGAGEQDDMDTVLTAVTGGVVPFREWIVVVLRSLELFPSLPSPPGGLEQFIRVAVDGTPQYSIEELCRAYGHTAAVSSSSTPQEALRERLMPFLDANRCLASYASALCFVEGWASVVEVANVVFDSLNGTSAGGCNAHLGQQERPVSSISSVPDLRASMAKALSIGELLQFIPVITTAIDTTSNFTSAAQEQIAAILGRTVLSLTEKIRQVYGNIAKAGETFTWSRTEVQSTLSSIINTLCLIGPRSTALREDLYNSLLVFLCLPNTAVDPVLLLRGQSQLFNMLLSDISESSSGQYPQSHQQQQQQQSGGAATSASARPTMRLSALNCLRTLLETSPLLCDAFCVAQQGNGCASTLTQFVSASLACVDALMVEAVVQGFGAREAQHVSYMIKSVFDILSLVSLQHAEAVYRSNAFSLCHRMKIWTVGTRLTLDFMSLLSSGSKQSAAAAAAGGSTAGDFSSLMFPEFTRGGNPATTTTGVNNNSSHAAGYTLLQRLLVGVLRWYNVALRNLPQFDEAVEMMANIVNTVKLLLQLAVSPGAVDMLLTSIEGPSSSSSSSATSARLSATSSLRSSGNTRGGTVAEFATTTSVSLVFEASELLFNFSKTCLAAQCSTLVETFAVPSVVLELCDRLAYLPVSSTTSATTSSSSINRLIGVARATRNFINLLVNVEVPTSSSSSSAQPVGMGRVAMPTAEAARISDVQVYIKSLRSILRTIQQHVVLASATASSSSAARVMSAPLATVAASSRSTAATSSSAMQEVSLTCVGCIHALALAISYIMAFRRPVTQDAAEMSRLMSVVDETGRSAQDLIGQLRDRCFSASKAIGGSSALTGDTTFADLSAEGSDTLISYNGHSNNNHYASSLSLAERTLQQCEATLINLRAVVASPPQAGAVFSA